MFMSGQARREKYPSHLILYETNILDPILSKKDKFPNIEKTTTAKSFRFAVAKTMREIINDAANRKNVICRSIVELPKNNILFFTTPA